MDGRMGERLAHVLVEFARTMITDFPIQGILDRLVESIVDVLPVTSAGVTLISPGRPPRYIAASDDSALRYERLQSQLGEGPCLSSYETGEAVAVPDLRATIEYPRFGPAAAEAGLVAVFTFPLRHGSHRLGALDLYRDTSGPLTAEDLRAAQILADVAAAYLTNAQARMDAARDQQRLAAAHQKAIESSRLKSQFVANMSHEVRTPLNGVIGMSALLLETELTDEQREYSDALRASGVALLAVVDEILDFSKLEAGKVELTDAPIPLAELMEEVATAAAADAQPNGVEVLVWVDGRLPTALVGDAARVRQVFSNLVGNAVKFTKSGDVSLQVTGEPEGGKWRLRFEVTDTGIGIDSDSLDRVFESFAQGDDSTTRRYGGTGLGLAISRQLVELMGGEIGVESTPGAGSTFWFTLTMLPVTGAPQFTVAAGLAGAHVLVVDDGAKSREFLVRQLGEWDISADGVRSEAVLERLRTAATGGRHYDAVLLGTGLPALDGGHVAAMRRAADAHPPAVVLLTMTHAERKAGESSGAEAVLGKPIRRQRLHDALAGALGIPAEEDMHAVEGPVPEPPEPTLPAAGSTGRLLVVEDNHINQLVTVRMLERRGYGVDVAENGRVALDLCRRNRYLAIFMDCHMPELDGYEATAEIRALEGSARRTPIIAMTANTMEGDRRKCLDAGMDDYIEKPVSAPALAEVLARSLLRTGTAQAGTSAPDAGTPAPVDEASAEVDAATVLLDRSALDELCGTDALMHAEIVELFENESQLSLSALDQAVAEDDADAVARAAHHLKGSAGSVGALRMSELSDRLCRAGRTGELSGVPGLLVELQLAFAATGSAWGVQPEAPPVPV